jgi:hypothetical protein
MNRFQPGNRVNPAGRPRGSRNRLASRVFEDVLAFWDQPAKEGSTVTRGQAALLSMWRERPHEFVRVVGGLLPRELLLETSVITEVSDEELERMIEQLRRPAMVVYDQQAFAKAVAETKMLPDASRS